MASESKYIVLEIVAILFVFLINPQIFVIVSLIAVSIIIETIKRETFSTIFSLNSLFLL